VIFIKGAHVIPIRASYKAEELLSTNDNVLPFKAEAGWTPLHIITWRKQTNLVEAALKTNDVNAQNDHGLTALHIAIDQEALDIIKQLMDGDANPNVANIESYTPFHLSALKGNVEALKAMVEKSELELTTKEGATAFLLAASSGCQEAIDLLISKGSSSDAKDLHGNGLFHYAASSLNPKIISDLLEKSPENLSLENNNKATLLHAAAKQGKWETCEMLIAKGLDPTQCDSEGNTIFHCAADFGNEEVIEKLLSSEWNWMIEAKNHKGQLPLHLAAKTAIDHNVMIKMTQATSNINEQDNSGNTPLFYSAESIKPHPMIVLLQEGANSRIPNHAGEYAIHKTVDTVNFYIPIILCVSEDYVLSDGNNNTPLHLALKTNESTASYLVPYVSREVLLQKNSDGMNCQDLAENCKTPGLLEKIIDKLHNDSP